MSRSRYQSIPLRRSAQYDMRHTTGAQLPEQTPRPTQSYTSSAHMPAMPDDDQLITRSPNSAIRYTDEYGRQVVQQGGRRYVMHDEEEPPPASQRPRQPQRHWLLIFGGGMLAMIALVALVVWAIGAWQAHQLDATYGMPRTWQTDQILGMNHDSSIHPSHLIFENLRGNVFFEIIPAGDLKAARVYPVTTLYGQDANNTPITADFRDVNGDGKVDIIVHIGDQGNIVFLNNGNTFSPQQ